MRAILEILATILALITSLAYKADSDAPTAVGMQLSRVILRVSEWRVEKGFEYKEAEDATLAVAMRILGPAVLLELLLLNLEPESR
jgi:ribosomal RNA-processing protein 12